MELVLGLLAFMGLNLNVHLISWLSLRAGVANL